MFLPPSLWSRRKQLIPNEDELVFLLRLKMIEREYEVLFGKGSTQYIAWMRMEWP